MMGFNPDQARDDHGRWAGGGGSGGTLSSGELANYAHASRGGKGTASPGDRETPDETRANEIENQLHEAKFMPPSERSALRQEQAGIEEKLMGASVSQQDHAEPTPQQGDADRHSAATAADTKAAGSMSRAAKVSALVQEGGYSAAEAKAMLTDMGE